MNYLILSIETLSKFFFVSKTRFNYKKRNNAFVFINKQLCTKALSCRKQINNEENKNEERNERNLPTSRFASVLKILKRVDFLFSKSSDQLCLKRRVAVTAFFFPETKKNTSNRWDDIRFISYKLFFLYVSPDWLVVIT